MTDEDKNDRSELPPEIGPHEGRELELMLAGKKPMAMFSEAVTVPISNWLPHEDFAPYVMSGALVRRDEIYPSPGGGPAGHYVYYALATESWRIEAAHRLHAEIFSDGRPASENDDQEIGRLLGYTEREIKSFLDRTREARPNRRSG